MPAENKALVAEDSSNFLSSPMPPAGPQANDPIGQWIAETPPPITNGDGGRDGSSVGNNTPSAFHAATPTAEPTNNHTPVAYKSFSQNLTPMTTPPLGPHSNVVNNKSNAPDGDHKSELSRRPSRGRGSKLSKKNLEANNNKNKNKNQRDFSCNTLDGNEERLSLVSAEDEVVDGNDSANSVESDYYYDDDGRARTYYRPRRYHLHLTEGDQELHTHGKKHKELYPENNGSIYIAPPSTKNHNDDEELKSHRTVSMADETRSAGTNASAGFSDNKSVLALPTNIRALAHKIHKLPTEELLYISAMVSRKAHREVYSVLQYSGEAWYLPEIRRTRPDEKEWEVKYTVSSGLIVSLCGRRMRIRLLSYFFRVCIMALIWFIGWCSSIPKTWSYRMGYFLDPYVTVLISAIVGGFICRVLQIPPLIGVLCVGIAWNNIGPEVGFFTSGILPQVRAISSRSGLAIIVLRAGWSININGVLPLLKNVGFCFVAMMVEVIVHAMMAQYYLEYDDWKWSFCQGLINAVPGAAIIVAGVLLLQAEGYSRSSGPLPLMLASLAFDCPIGVWAASFTTELITSDKSIGFLAGMGPVQIFGGLAAGMIAAAIIHIFVSVVRREADRMPSGKYSEGHLQNVRFVAVITVLLMGHGLLFLAYDISMTGGGVVAAITMAFCLAWYWGKDNDPEWMEMKREVGGGLSKFWDLAAMPYLFSIAGSNIVLSRVFNKNQFPKALLIVVVSSIARVGATFFTSYGLGFTWKERVYHSVASMSKATVQIAMGSGPLTAFLGVIQGTDKNDPQYAFLEAQLEKADMFQTTCVLFALISAPLSAIWIFRMGPKMLRQE